MSPQQKFRSLKFRLMSLIAIILLLVVGIPVGLFVHLLDKNYSEFSTNMIETTSQVVYQFIYEGMMKNDSTIIQKNLELLALDPSLNAIRLSRPDGQILYSSDRSEIEKNIHLLSKFAFDGRKDKAEELFYRDDNSYYHHHLIRVAAECTPCHHNPGELIAVLDVQATFTPSEQLYVTVKNLAIFGGIIITIILWILLNLVYQAQVESRLHLIMKGLDKLSLGNFNFKIKMPGRDELKLLADKFNLMVESLKQSRHREDQFYQEKLERADRLVTLGEVAAEIAHEVNNPAGIILTRAEYLKEELNEKGINSGCIEDLDIIIQQTGKIAETTKSILHYSRKLPHQFAETNLAELIKHAVKILEPRIKKSKTDLQLVMPEYPCRIWGNYNQLEQVFCNLINNSLDFLTPQEGVIRIRVNETKARNSKTYYRIIYEDNGPGIPMEYQDRIFSPFFTTKESDKGTGLGLFIAKNIILNHKGTIQLASDYTEGAMFIIELEANHG